MAMMLLLLGMFASLSRGQSNNCCQIQVGGVNASGSTMTVPASASGPGGTYTFTQTDTYPIACFNTATQKACNLASPPNNVVMALGAGANVNDRFIDCSPTFEPITTQASPRRGSPPPLLIMERATRVSTQQTGIAFSKIPNRSTAVPASWWHAFPSVSRDVGAPMFVVSITSFSYVRKLGLSRIKSIYN